MNINEIIENQCNNNENQWKSLDIITMQHGVLYCIDLMIFNDRAASCKFTGNQWFRFPDIEPEWQRNDQ